MSKKIKSILAIVLLSVTQFLYAEETPIKWLNEYKLENGLTLFTKENHNSPVVYMEIAVKAGAVTQNAQNAGLFHLYEQIDPGIKNKDSNCNSYSLERIYDPCDL